MTVHTDPVTVVGNDGLTGTFERPTGPGPVSSVEVALSDGRRVVVPAHLLQARTDGSYYLPVVPADADAAGGHAAVIAPGPSAAAAAGPSVIPLVEEQVQVTKRRVETGRVRVVKAVEVHDEVVDVPVHREDVTVERVPVERFVTEPPPVRHEGDVTIVSVVEEVLVVEKRLMVREEVRLTTRRTETHEPRTVSLRKEVARVERVPAD